LHQLVSIRYLSSSFGHSGWCVIRKVAGVAAFVPINKAKAARMDKEWFCTKRIIFFIPFPPFSFVLNGALLYYSRSESKNLSKFGKYKKFF